MGGPTTTKSQTFPTNTNTRQLQNTMPTPRKIPFPPGKKLFTADDVTIYPNLYIDEGMLTMEIAYDKKNTTYRTTTPPPPS